MDKKNKKENKVKCTAPITQQLKETSQNMFDFNTPHSWSNVSGYGNIHINTSDNKKSSNPWNRLHKLE